MDSPSLVYDVLVNVLQIHSNFAVVIYFLILGWAIKTSVAGNRKHQSVLINFGCSLAIIAITWFYIFRFIKNYHSYIHSANASVVDWSARETAGNYRDDDFFFDAYVDVLKHGHFGLSSQLLTWVAVVAVYFASEDISFFLYGMLGAMAATYATRVDEGTNLDTIAKRYPSIGVPWSYLVYAGVMCYAVTMMSYTVDYCIPDEFPQKITQVASHTPTTVESFDTDRCEGLVFSFDYYLIMLHAMVLVPKLQQLARDYLQVDTLRQHDTFGNCGPLHPFKIVACTRINTSLFYALLAMIVVISHALCKNGFPTDNALLLWKLITGEFTNNNITTTTDNNNNNSNSIYNNNNTTTTFVVNAFPTTDCQISISYDVLFSSVLCLYCPVYTDAARLMRSVETGTALSTIATISYTVFVFVAMVFLTPAFGFAMHLSVVNFVQDTLPSIVHTLQRRFALECSSSSSATSPSPSSKSSSSSSASSSSSSSLSSKNDELQWMNLGLEPPSSSSMRSKQPKTVNSNNNTTTNTTTNNINTNKNINNINNTNHNDNNNTDTTNVASENLARFLADKLDLNESDGVLTCGAGSGVELEFIFNEYNVKHVTGIEENFDAVHKFQERFASKMMTHGAISEKEARALCNIRIFCMSVNALSTCDVLTRKHLFSKVMAIDSIYHFDYKLRWFEDVKALAPSRVGVTDFVVRDTWLSHTSPLQRFCFKLVLRCLNVKSLWTEKEYRSKLEGLGYTDVSFSNVVNDGDGDDGVDDADFFQSSTVFAEVHRRVTKSAPTIRGSLAWALRFTAQALTYKAITMSVRDDRDDRERVRTPPKVAVIGSGISGLAAASFLQGHCEVTVYDMIKKGCTLSSANEIKLGRTGKIDMPLRMLVPLHYRNLLNLTHKLHVSTKPLLDSSEGGAYRHNVTDEQSPEKSVVRATTLSDVFHDARLILNALFSEFFYVDHTTNIKVNQDANIEPVNQPQADATGSETGDQQSWGNYMGRIGFFKMRSERDYELPIERNLLSWALTCTRDQVLSYPGARYVNPFLLACFKQYLFGIESARRVNPSMGALEFALRYNIKLVLNEAVTLNTPTKVGGKMMHRIGDELFDYVVVCTPPSAVPTIVKNTGMFSDNERFDIFAKFGFQPSHSYVHTDARLMPVSKRDWRTLNVLEMPNAKPGDVKTGDVKTGDVKTGVGAGVDPKGHRGMSQLTVWINEFLGAPKCAEFGLVTDTFVTWNPIWTPEKNKILHESSFTRVLFNAENVKELHSRIDELQGKSEACLKTGIYFAGAYSIPGMNLLEEGTTSSQNVAAQIVKELETNAL